MSAKIKNIFLAILFVLPPINCFSFPVEDMQGFWIGNATSAFYRPRTKIPDSYEVSNLKVKVYKNSIIEGDFDNGCQFRGKIMRSSASQYPINGVVGLCADKRMNGNFEGMFNRVGEIRIVVKDKSLGYGDFYGKLLKSEFRRAF